VYVCLFVCLFVCVCVCACVRVCLFVLFFNFPFVFLLYFPDPFRMRDLVGRHKLPIHYNKQLDNWKKDGSTLKVNK